ncbi:MAG: hypothetical protein H0X62_12985, partial [Bacteroidetes bacterium]|nr:hypothetical protein [Bacteroidota bacterium]
MKKSAIYLLIFLASISSSFAQAVKVEIQSEKNGFTMLRDGKPYYIKGACAWAHYDKLKAYGGNSIRLWTTENAKYYLDKAHEHGLTVTLGLFLEPERKGFDYNDKAEVKKQFDFLKGEVLKHKDHPALLMWGIGNEVELFATNPKVWNAINDLAKMIKDVDPNHPTTTMLAGVPEKEMSNIIKRCPDLDLLSINAFKDLENVHTKLQAHGWKKPYIISEWGPDGYWETKTTKWDRFIEDNSTVKAEQYKVRYERIIKPSKNQCLGSYVFLWGHKQERSHTYFSMILESGHETEGVDVMKYLWTGKYPEHRAPRIKEATINNKGLRDNIYLKPGTKNTATVKLQEENTVGFTYYWEIIPESEDLRDGGEGETKPPVLNTAIPNPLA